MTNKRIRKQESQPLAVFLARRPGDQDIEVASYVDEGTHLIANAKDEIYAPISMSGHSLSKAGTKVIKIGSEEIATQLVKLCTCSNPECASEIFTSKEFSEYVAAEGENASIACVNCGTTIDLSSTPAEEQEVKPEEVKIPGKAEEEAPSEVPATSGEPAKTEDDQNTEEEASSEDAELEQLEEQLNKDIANLLKGFDSEGSEETAGKDEDQNNDDDDSNDNEDEDPQENDDEDSNNNNNDNEDGNENDNENEDDENDENEDDENEDKNEDEDEDEDEESSSLVVDLSAEMDFDPATITVSKVNASVLAVFVDDENGKPDLLGTLHEENASTECKEMFSRFDLTKVCAAVRACIEAGDNIDNLGFRPVTKAVRIDSLISTAIENRKTDIETASAERLEDHKQDFIQSISIAVAGMNKGFFENPLAASIARELRVNKVPNYDTIAATVVAAAADEYMRQVITKAEDLLKEGKPAFEALAKIITEKKSQVVVSTTTSSAIPETSSVVNDLAELENRELATSHNKSGQPSILPPNRKLFRPY